jgi:CHAT domain-containing protein
MGEAVTGLNRALQLAGVRNTITSLWKVDDDGAAAFFRAFYAVIREGFGPGVWAGFVLYVRGAGR